MVEGLQNQKTELPGFEDYAFILDALEQLKPEKKDAKLRWLILNDLYFLLRYGCRRHDIERQWLFDRCREVQADPNGYIDLWSRDHYKSTIITFGLTIQDILNDPESTFGFFSHTRPIAKAFLRQIKQELENNIFLQGLFPEILFENPQRESPKWSEDEGITIKRQSNPKEATIEAWGLVDGQPTSKHYKTLVYDDVVTQESVSTPEQIDKTTKSWELSLNLASADSKKRYIGTRYHFNDTYAEILKRGSATARIHPATEDGTAEGTPVLLTEKLLAEKRRDMGIYTFASQMLLNPVADQSQGFKRDWLRFHREADSGSMTKYMLVDPANAKRKRSDFTVIFVVGLGQDSNYYILDIVRDRLNLTERAKTVFDLHRKWKPLKVGYEQYGMQADIQHIKEKQDRETYHFEIVPLGGNMGKLDRIRRLIPLFEAGRIYLPESLNRTNYERKTEDLVQVFINDEYLSFPLMVHDDMLDDLARITDEDLQTDFPEEKADKSVLEMMQGSRYQIPNFNWYGG